MLEHWRESFIFSNTRHLTKIRKARIPLSQIYDVTENVWLNIHPVTIHLKAPSEFGDRIIFIPKSRLFAFFSSHPVVAELKELARSKSTPAGTGRERLSRR